MMYLERLAVISSSAQLTEEESNILRELTDPLNSNKKYPFRTLCSLFRKLIIDNQYEDFCRSLEHKNNHFETEPSAYPELTDEVQIG